MKLSRIIFTGCAALLTASVQAQDAPTGTEQYWPMLENYCMSCHNYDDYSGGVAFDLMAPHQIGTDAATWETALRKLRGRLMPPPGSDQPSQGEIDGFIAWMEGNLDHSTEHTGVGHVPVQRLNRTEFGLAVRDLLGVEINPEDFLPSEIEVDGFENIAATLSVSPSFLDQYINAARFVAHKAIGEPLGKMANVYYPSPGGRQSSFEDGMPMGSRGGMKIRHNFPTDGEYRFNILDLDAGLYPRGMEQNQTVVVLVDGVEVFRENIGGQEDLALVNLEGAAGSAKIMERFQDIPVALKAGTHDLVFTFIERARSASDSTVSGGFGFGGGARFLDGIEINGPYNPSGVSMTASRARIFVCEPQSTAEEKACAEKIIANLTRRAFRREVNAADIASYMPFFEAGRAMPAGFDAGIEQVVAAVLASPDFLYRGISPTKDIGDAEMFALSDNELATRMAFFLWGQGPDEALLTTALSGKLTNADVMQAELSRMLADKKADYLIDNFALRWLNLDDMSAIDPEPAQFRGFNNALREDFKKEVALYLGSIMLEDRPVTDILTASHTFLNERLARHYGIDDVYGDQFRRVELADERRWGILGKSAVLLRTSYGDRTSPVLRGAWVLEKLLGTPPSPPPPNVETDLSVPAGQKATTVRARLENHRANPSCNQCHGVIDPIGLALENYTVIGQWRDRDVAADAPIDARTVMPSGQAINGPVELRNELGKKPAQFAMAMTERLLMYAINRELEYFDMPVVRDIVRSAADENYTLSSLVLGIVNSPAFRMQALPESDAHIEVAATNVQAAQ